MTRLTCNVVQSQPCADDFLNVPSLHVCRPGFNLTNELINGRAAMFGLALLLIYEAGARGPLF